MAARIFRKLTTLPRNRPDDLDGDTVLHNVSAGGKFRIVTVATEHSDSRGQTGIRVLVWQNKSLVYDTGQGAAGLVYGSPLYCDDAPETLLSAITLVCHDAQHDAQDSPVTPNWDADDLYNLAAMAGEDEGA